MKQYNYMERNNELEKNLNLIGFNVIQNKEDDRKKEWIILVCKKFN